MAKLTCLHLSDSQLFVAVVMAWFGGTNYEDDFVFSAGAQRPEEEQHWGMPREQGVDTKGRSA